MTPRVAVIGAGAWGRNHVRTLHQLGALHAIVDASPDLREAMAQAYPGVLVCATLAEAMLSVDGVVISTPAPFHAAMAKEALSSGKGILVEKPMTLDLAEAEDLCRAGEASGQVSMVGHLLLFQPAIQELKRQLDRGLVGKVYRIDQERLNHGRVRRVENVWWSFACHDIAVLLFLMGESPSRVTAAGAAFLQPGIEDDVHAEFAFSSGRTAHIHVGWYWPGKQRRLRVMGEAGMVVFDESDQSLTLHRKRVDGAFVSLDEGEEVLYRGHGEPLLLEDQHFLDCLKTGSRPLSDVRSGYEVVRILHEANRQLKESA